ncbi:hypothetical protein QBC33DRAFT_623041 [Phialemonium atrogriseum]|uniref:non-specific serine/threonine protein kinase n=1 Tax=Phialemonium atrogriseum TaxID=1093897 RepID=A0AAJ0FHB0_9PEZI|nr:uncharacterized protein QBC33DRAFT_623041 [Phialemonium atrogriseum]KAK1763213.1 hypothetical protein QBC33DRAFT_623041 [Phialemonium atrogriseum]
MENAPIIAKLRALWQKRPQRLSALWHRRFSVSMAPMAPMIDEPVEEELLPGNRLRFFHPTRPGKILNGRFKTIVKLGYGANSTVNLQFKRWKKSSVLRYVSIKIAALDTDIAWETRISMLIANADPLHEGLAFIRMPIDELQLRRLEGTHSCLVYTPMRETLFQLQHRLRRQRLAPPLFKFFIYCLLEAVDYLHTNCGLIHTGKAFQRLYWHLL